MAVEIRYKVVPLMKTFFCGKLLWSRKNLFLCVENVPDTQAKT